MTKSNEELEKELEFYKNQLVLFINQNTSLQNAANSALHNIRDNDNIKPIQWNNLEALDSKLYNSIQGSKNLQTSFYKLQESLKSKEKPSYSMEFTK